MGFPNEGAFFESMFLCIPVSPCKTMLTRCMSEVYSTSPSADSFIRFAIREMFLLSADRTVTLVNL